MKYNFKNSTIGDACLLVTDGSHFSPKSVEHGEYMVSVKDFTPYGFDFDNCRQISANDYEKLKKSGCIPQYEDILIGKDGARYFEDIVVYRQTEQPALLSSIAILRCNTNELLPDYLYYMMINPAFKQNVRDNYGSGSAIPRIILKDFKRMPISYPSIKVQQRIISILRGIDAKIELNSKINANLQQQAQAIFKSWFVDFEPFQDGEFVESELGTIPVEFTITRTGGLPLIVTDYVANGSFASLKANVHLYQERNYAYFIRNTDLKSGEFKVFVDEHSYNFLSKSRLQGGEIIISNVGDVGSVFLCPVLDGPMTLGNNIIMLKPERQELQYYLYIWFKWSLGQSLMQGIKSGSAQPKFNKTDFKSLPIVLPPEKILQEFHELVSPIFKLVEKNQVENRKIAMLRDVLLPKLMNGAIDIRKD